MKEDDLRERVLNLKLALSYILLTLAIGFATHDAIIGLSASFIIHAWFIYPHMEKNKDKAL